MQRDQSPGHNRGYTDTMRENHKSSVDSHASKVVINLLTLKIDLQNKFLYGRRHQA